jgi:dephospho-CoA kinase
MISIAITGGIGSGKTFVSNLLKERGIPIYNSDDEAKRLMVSDEGIRRDLIALLGEDVYQGDALNKSLLASYLFTDAGNAARINAIVHPRVRADFSRWLAEHQDVEVAGLECAILYEAGFENTVDKVVMVYAPESLRIERAMKRDNATESQIRARIAAQMDDEEKSRRSDYVIYTDGRFSVEEQLSDLIKHLKTTK